MTRPTSRKERLANVLEAILDRLDSIDRKQTQVVDVVVSLTRDVSTHDAELVDARSRLAELERRTARLFDAE